MELTPFSFMENLLFLITREAVIVANAATIDTVNPAFGATFDTTIGNAVDANAVNTVGTAAAAAGILWFLF